MIITSIRLVVGIIVLLHFDMNPIQYHLVNSTNLTFISEVTLTSSVISLSWSQGSEYVYGINGSNSNTNVSISTSDLDVSIYVTTKYIMAHKLCQVYALGDCIKDRGLFQCY